VQYCCWHCTILLLALGNPYSQAALPGVDRIFNKIQRFKRVADLPAMLVGVEGLPKASPHVSLGD
jgi:hypothetical protein